tara:strand:- start:114 stop:725 length:612 start_codon:yes stop_codon:yes gene_type:complete
LKKNRISKNWINRQKRDIYVKKSKQEGYRSRAVYKLSEINDKFKILRNGMLVIDLGSAPGSWSQFLSKKIKNGKILSIDLKKVDNIKNVRHLVGDFSKLDQKKMIKNYFNSKIDLIVSDMASNTTGNKNLDAITTGELSFDAMNFSKEVLKKDGQFVSKIFMGSNFNEIVQEAKKIFIKVNIFKPPSSRKSSKENFLICKILK